MTATQSSNFGHVRNTLYRDLQMARKNVDADPSTAVLDLCRIVYSFKRGKKITSNQTAATWAAKKFPEWSRLIKKAKLHSRDGLVGKHAVLRKEARKFVGFATVRAVSFDAAWDIRASTARLRTKSGRIKK